MFHFAGGVAFGVDVAEFFEFECAFEGDGHHGAATEEEDVAAFDDGGGEAADVGIIGDELGGFGGDFHEGFDEVGDGGVGEGGAGAGEGEGEGGEHGHLGGDGFGAGDADFGAGDGFEGEGAVASDGAFDGVDDGDCLAVLLAHIAKGGEGVGGFTGLADDEAEGGWFERGVAVAKFAGDVGIGWDAGVFFEPVAADEAGVEGGAAGGDDDAADGAQIEIEAG